MIGIRATDPLLRIKRAIVEGLSPEALIVAPDAAPLWVPNPGPQTDAYTSLADELFYGGAGGGGKTDLTLGLAATAHTSSIIYRREFAQFRGPEGIISRSKQIIGDRGDFNGSLYTWVNLPGGRALEFGAVQREDDKNKYKGRPHDLKAFDELPEFSESQYRFLIAWLRTSRLGQRTRVVGTGNPPTTAEGEWVIRYWSPWLDPQHPRPAKPGELRWFASIDGKDVELASSDPIVHGGETIRPRSRTFIPARVEDNPYYMRTGYIDVLNSLPEPLRSQLRHGNFAAAQADNPWQVIPTAWVVAAQERWAKNPHPPEGVPLTQVGADISRGGGDATDLAKRYGYWVAPVEKHPGKQVPDGPAAAGLIFKAVDGDTSVPIGIDVIGVGSSAYDHARGLSLNAIALNGSEASSATDKSGKLHFVNKRAEWHWRLREALDPTSGMDIALPPDTELRADLCAPRWKPTPRGIQVEPKDDVKARIGRSPDCGEAVIYAFAEGDNGFLRWMKGKATSATKPDLPPAPAPGDDADELVLKHQACRMKGLKRTVTQDGRVRCATCGCDLGRAS